MRRQSRRVRVASSRGEDTKRHYNSIALRLFRDAPRSMASNSKTTPKKRATPPRSKALAPAVRQADLGRTRPQKALHSFPNPSPGRDFLVHIEIPEFTCLCPLTGQPDFATIVLDYIPEASCVELKSLKLYMWSFRDRGVFHEAVTNQILDHLIAVLAPRFVRVTAKWYVRGGLFTNVIAEHRAAWFQPQPTVDLAALGAVALARPTA
jgi:7-cyano-7-deazaguanine reductase